jgi:carboxyl-terminal processing protease
MKRTLGFWANVILVAFFPLLTFVAGFAAHWYLTRDQIPVSTVDLKVFWEVWRLLDRSFLGEPPSTAKRTYGAIHGLVASYQDPYTAFVEPQPRQREREDLKGEFGGIGAWVNRESDGTYSMRPMPDLPAAQAGVQEGDILIAVDGREITKEMAQNDVIDLIRGPIGSVVRIQVRRAGAATPLAFAIKRQRIETPSVQWRMVEQPPHTGYIQLSIFSERTGAEMADAVRSLTQEGANRIVFDLRHNGGGLVDAAVDTASIFLRDGVVLYEMRSGETEKAHPVRQQPVTFEGPLVVLVDGGTASAAEIVAGALQDRGRALLYGEKSFGKGSVQSVHDLSDGSSLHVTMARWLTPNRRRIDGQGLEPDFPVVMTDEDREAGRDPVLERALERLAAAP